MPQVSLPTEQQREALCDLMHTAFVELRYLNGQQANDLAYALHNLPKEMYGWGTWNPSRFRAGLAHYQAKYAETVGFDYVEAVDVLFPPSTRAQAS